MSLSRGFDRIGAEGDLSSEAAYIARYISNTRGALEKLDVEALSRAFSLLRETVLAGGFVFTCGNGGSATTALHFVVDIGKGEKIGFGRRVRALSLVGNVGLLTAWANDRDYQVVFSEQLRNFAAPGDLVIAFSGSGNSPNVLKAVEIARELGAKTLGITGFDGGRLKSLVDCAVVVPSSDMQHVEDCHLVIAHALCCAARDLLAEFLSSPPLRS